MARASSEGGLDLPSLERIFRTEYGAVVATLTRVFGSIDLAEDMAQEAFVAACERWPDDGLPPNPGGWLMTTARRKGIDRLRREARREDKHAQALVLDSEPEDVGPVYDDRLRLMFTCAHPALNTAAQTALILRLLGGLSVAEIARAFLAEERALAQRITRAKRKIAQARIPYRVPQASDLPTRLDGVLTAIYLIFNEGYLATAGSEPIRRELCAEAIRLGRLVVELLPQEPEARGLLALMLLSDARRPARQAGAELVPLDEQDRDMWDRDQIAEGHRLVRECLVINRPGRFQLLAAINAVHTSAATFQQTDWAQIVALYDQLEQIAGSDVVRLNRAIALAELDGPAAGLRAIDALELPAYADAAAARADLLRRLGRTDEAAAAYDEAIRLTQNPAQREFWAARRAAL